MPLPVSACSKQDWRWKSGGHGEGVDLHAALEKLTEVDSQLARIAELRCFSGLEQREIGRLLDVSTKTVERRWKTARAWLQKELDAPIQ